MKHGVRCFFASMGLLLSAMADAAGPRNIFDDDWTPPKSTAATQPVSTQPARPPAVVPPAATPLNPAPAAPSVRRAVPTRAEQTAVRALMKEVFAEQLADRSIPARRKLAEALLAQADKSVDAPIDQFVLLAAAVDAATEAERLPLALNAGDRMARIFDVDALALKADTATRLTAKPGPNELAAENVRAGLEVVAQLEDAEDFAAANRVCLLMVQVAGVNPTLRAEVQKRQRELSVAREAREKIARHLEKLKTSPDDAAANLEVGKYLCFCKDDWTNGLPLLVKGSDAGLKTLAAQELAGSSADAMITVADGWWDMAAKQPEPAMRINISAHSATLYKHAVDKTSGLKRAQIEKRIAAAPAIPAHLGTVGAKASKVTVTVLATSPWQAFGEVKQGDELVFTAEGQWTHSTGKKRLHGPGVGSKGGVGKLEGRIGESGVIFPIGAAANYSATQSGILYMQMHDTNFADNGGQVTVTIERQAAKSPGSADSTPASPKRESP